jgi:hypothetical protein
VSANEDYDAAEDWFERNYTQRESIANEFLDRYAAGEREFRISWPRIRKAPIKRIWLTFGKIGFLHARQEALLEGIADRTLTLIARLYACTEICGHTPRCGRESLEDETQDRFTDESWEHMLMYSLEDERGNWYLSDFAWPKLEPLYDKLFRAKTPDQQLYLVDQVLNVVHQRSDLASYFIEGGSKTLREIFSQGGYTSDTDE